MKILVLHFILPAALSLLCSELMRRKNSMPSRRHEAQGSGGKD